MNIPAEQVELLPLNVNSLSMAKSRLVALSTTEEARRGRQTEEPCAWPEWYFNGRRGNEFGGGLAVSSSQMGREEKR